jgi:MoxR-like ATPase
MVDMTPDRYAETAAAIEAQVGKVIVGQTDLVRSVLVCLLCEGHALLEGVPGLGKTMLLRTLADAVDVEFARVQFTPDLMPADIVGTQVLEPGEHGDREFRFRAGPVFANLVLADEINRATPKTQSALLEAMQEKSVTVGGVTRPLPRPFLVMATQNPLEMEGTYPLPEAQLDRFLAKIHVPLPPADDLFTILERTTGSDLVEVEAVADAEQLAAMVGLTREVPIADHVTRYAVDLVVASHPDQEAAPDLVRRYVRFGSSPRGAQALVLASKATALLAGRPASSVDDVRAVALGSLRHRLVLGYEATADGVSADQIVNSILEAVPEPGAGIRGAP